MTPKEKAIQLVSSFDELGRDFTRGVSMKEFSKQCALIAVDEILTYQEQLLQNYKVKLENSYWYKVQQEIEKL